jgi:hypothetical protein
VQNSIESAVPRLNRFDIEDSLRWCAGMADSSIRRRRRGEIGYSDNATWACERAGTVRKKTAAAEIHRVDNWEILHGPLNESSSITISHSGRYYRAASVLNKLLG